MRNDKFKEILINIPISVNAQLGDPFQETQWKNTKEKLLILQQQEYKGPVALITKSVLTEEQIGLINDLKLDIFIFLSITGLNENRKVTFNQISENYLQLCETNKKVAIFIRPIIPGYNDSLPVLEPIIQLAALGQKVVIIRGYKDIYNLDEKCKISSDFLAILKKTCAAYRVQVFDKTMYYVASLRKNHFANKHREVSENAVLLLQKLGYPIKLSSGNLELSSEYNFSQGDLNFIRMITGKKINMNLQDNNAIMTIKKTNMLDCSSSWFGWPRRIPCQINCWYCISKVEQFNKDKDIELGCCPTDLLM